MTSKPNSLAGFSTLGFYAQELATQLAENRPEALEQAVANDRLFEDLIEANEHFNARTLYHNKVFYAVHPEPEDPRDRDLHILRRKGYIKQEVAREMANWINGYPRICDLAQ